MIMAYEYAPDWAFPILLAHPKIVPSVTNAEGQSLVHLMVRQKDLESMKKLDAAFPTPEMSPFRWNMRDRNGMTAMHEAVMIQDLDIVKFLGERGASPWTNNRKGLSPRELAQKNGAIEIFTYLTELENQVKPSFYEDFEPDPRWEDSSTFGR